MNEPAYATDPEYLSLCASVVAVPGDDTVRLVFADWFDERGEHERAEFIRVQIERSKLLDDSRCAAKLTPHTPEWSAALNCQCRTCFLAKRDEHLWLYHSSPWDECVIGEWRGGGLYKRGFVHSISPDTATFLRYAAELFSRFPIEWVRLSNRVPDLPTWEENNWRWFAGADDDPAPAVVPERIAAFGLRGESGDMLTFETDDDAWVALSQACVRYGRHAAGLPIG